MVRKHKLTERKIFLTAAGLFYLTFYEINQTRRRICSGEYFNSSMLDALGAIDTAEKATKVESGQQIGCSNCDERLHTIKCKLPPMVVFKC